MVQEFPGSPTAAEPRLSWRILTEFTLDGIAGNERQAVDHIASAVQDLNLLPWRVERLKTAVAEATLNAIEYRSWYEAECPVLIRLLVSKRMIPGHISTGGHDYSKPESQSPGSEAKTVRHPLPGGWGFFLVERRVDDTYHKGKKQHHVIEAFLYSEGELGES
jgi:anti-sigma regulatory factor (Ser/Thr protein kinase)